MNDVSKNILILSAGKRVELIRCFQKARDELRLKGNVIAVDISETAPALYFADKFYLIPRIEDEEYIPALIEVCRKEKIHLIVPTIDTELLKLTQNRQMVEEATGAKLLLSCDETVSVCVDKTKTQGFFEKNNFGCPHELTEKELNSETISFPLFIKPKDGSSSINAFKIHNDEELFFFRKYVKNPIVQSCVEGTEYSIDVFCDFDGNPVTIVPRIRLAVRNGEIAKGKIVKDREIIDDVKRMIDVLKPIGQITIQCMKTKEGIKYLEINPRFGGGAPMSIGAGADSCKALYQLLKGEKLSYREDYQENLLCLRFDNCIFLNEQNEVVQ